jgi:glyoxylase-like metal-dependent hydrolase (beta-lactamase superfamily II)
LYACESECKDIDECILPEGFEVVDLPGHSFDMFGIKTPDGVLFAADSVSSVATLEKYGISFLFDVRKYLDSLDKLCNFSAEYFVPSHADVVSDMKNIVSINKNKVFEIIDAISEYLSSEKTFEDLLAHLFDKYNLTMTNEQYVLIGSTIKSYLSYLKDEGKVVSLFDNNKMYWKSI